MSNEPSRILIALPTWVGDAVMATPALRAIRLAFPRAQVAWLGGRAALETLAGLPLADATVPDASKMGLGGFLATAKLIRREGFDAAVLLSNSFRSALLCRLGRCRQRIGYDRDGRGWLLTDRLIPARLADGSFQPVSAIEYYQALADRLIARRETAPAVAAKDSAGGMAACRPCEPWRMELAVEEPFARQAEKLFAEAGIEAGRPVAVINPGASFGSSKLYPADRMAAVTEAMVERHAAHIIINAAPSEGAIAMSVASAMRHKPAINFGQQPNSLGLLKAVLARSTLLITGDTGPRHMAAALGIGVVTIFGSTDPRWTEIHYPRERIVLADAACRPCQQKVCPLPAGPEHHTCMTSIPASSVIAAAEDLLGGSEGQP